jgi:hypothetical protein
MSLTISFHTLDVPCDEREKLEINPPDQGKWYGQRCFVLVFIKQTKHLPRPNLTSFLVYRFINVAAKYKRKIRVRTFKHINVFLLIA